MDDFATMQSSITSALVATTRSASQLAAEDLSFHRSLSSTLGSQLDRENERLLSLADRLLATATTGSTAASYRPRLSDIEAVEGNWRAVVDVLDSLLERADTALDEFTGAVRRLSPGAAEDAGKAVEKAARSVRSNTSWKNQEIEKPQLLFDNVPKNDETEPFMPLLTDKPHHKVPLSERKPGEHPYRAEIQEYVYPDEVYTRAEPIMYHPFETTTATFVDTEEAVHEMLAELEQAKVIAIDLEHHDQRSYIGLVSLMQISTRDRDWIVDTLKPWRRKLSCLNSVFANPAILKVLHGAYMDVVWLQRDLGLYLVGLFDTHYASRALGYSGGSLAFLLKKFANVDAQKQYQMADWRIRPLPQELFDYARSDTHYLLYIYDNMRNELIDRSDFNKPDGEGDKLLHVLQKSSETALQVYEHPVYDIELGQGANGWYKLLSRTPGLLSREQFAVFRAVHKWRDDAAREQDDSTYYVMPQHQIFSLAKAMPMSKPELFNAAHPATQTLRLRADELVDVIVRAKEEGKNGPDMMETMARIEPQFPRKGAAHRDNAAHSVAAFLPKAAETPPAPSTNVAPVFSTLPLRSATSTFWGPAIGANNKIVLQNDTVPNVSLTVPLPPLTAEIFADADEVMTTPSRPTEVSSPEPTPVETPAADEEETFILKEMGRKRKRSNHPQPASNGVMDGMAANNDEVALTHDSESERLAEKAARKKSKKEAKRAAKAAAAADGTSAALSANEKMDDTPFDYASAPSILNPPREGREEMRERRKKVINPYAKSMDAPRGLGRVQKERAGRSMTYKS